MVILFKLFFTYCNPTFIFVRENFAKFVRSLSFRHYFTLWIKRFICIFFFINESSLGCTNKLLLNRNIILLCLTGKNIKSWTKVCLLYNRCGQDIIYSLAWFEFKAITVIPKESKKLHKMKWFHSSIACSLMQWTFCVNKAMHLLQDLMLFWYWLFLTPWIEGKKLQIMY